MVIATLCTRTPRRQLSPDFDNRFCTGSAPMASPVVQYWQVYASTTMLALAGLTRGSHRLSTRVNPLLRTSGWTAIPCRSAVVCPSAMLSRSIMALASSYLHNYEHPYTQPMAKLRPHLRSVGVVRGCAPGGSKMITVVTGASRGAGKGIAMALGAVGATVYVTGRSVADSDSPFGGTVGD